MTIEIREGRGVGPEADHIHLQLSHLPRKSFMNVYRGFLKLPQFSPGLM